MLNPLFLLLLFLLLLSKLPLLAHCLDCYPPPVRTSLPLLSHCQELTYALTIASRLPFKNGPKEWGRGLQSTDFTEHLPKLYWLPGRGPQTCGISLDVDPLFPAAREVFRIGDIALAATRLVNLCLIGRREVGREALGREGKVLAKLVRTDAPGWGRRVRGREGRWGSVRVPGVGRLLWASGRDDNGTVEEMR